jgi:hypothetical protein
MPRGSCCRTEVRFLERERNRHGAARIGTADRERGALAVQCGEPTPDGTQSETLFRSPRATTVISDFEKQTLVIETRAEMNQAALWPIGDAVADRVLDDWLKDERWNHDCECIDVCRDVQTKPLAEAQLFE